MSNEINNLVGFDGFVLDTKKKILWCEEEIVELPLKATELLCVLIESKGEVVSKDTLLDKVWQDSFVEEGVLPQNVYRLRRAFKKFGADEDLIQTVPRRGYRFSGNFSELVEEEISIEKETFERKFISESFSTENEIPVSKNVLAEKSQASFFQTNKIFAVSVFGVFILFAIASIWLWKSSNTENPKGLVIADKIKFSRITDSGNANFPAISRDNQNIAYVRSENNTSSIILQNVSTRSETIVVKPKPYEIRSLNFSADGNYLYYITREIENPESTIYQVPIYGGTRRKIITNVRHYFSISPDGEKFAFYRYNPERDEYYLMTCDTDGNNEKIIATRKSPNFFRDWNTYPAWSPDGKNFVVSAHTNISGKDEKESRSYFVEIDASTGEEKVLRHPAWESAFQAFWLKDASSLIVSARENINDYAQLWYLSYPEGKATRITNDTNHYHEFRTSFDSKLILAAKVTTGSNLFTISTEDSEEVRQLTNQMIADYGSKGIDWTADGKHLIYVKAKGRSDGNLWKMNVETLEEQQLTFDEKFTNVNPEAMPDGKSILFQSNRTGKWQLWQIGLDGKNLRQITNGADGAMRPDISSDGEWIFYHAPAKGPSELWKMQIAGGEAVKVLQNAAGVSKPSPADPNQIIAYYYDPAEKNEIPWKYILFSQHAKELFKDLRIETENHSFSWNRDGTGIYFPKKQMNQNNLWFLSIKENSLKQVTNFKAQKIVNLSLSPDGENIVFARSARTSNIFEISGFLPN